MKQTWERTRHDEEHVSCFCSSEKAEVKRLSAVKKRGVDPDAAHSSATEVTEEPAGKLKSEGEPAAIALPEKRKKKKKAKATATEDPPLLKELPLSQKAKRVKKAKASGVETQLHVATDEEGRLPKRKASKAAPNETAPLTVVEVAKEASSSEKGRKKHKLLQAAEGTATQPKVDSGVLENTGNTKFHDEAGIHPVAF